MAIKTKASSSSSTAISYVDFEPHCEWQNEGAQTLIIHLPGFKKDQLRVMVNNKGVLRASGERPESGDMTRRRRFLKETAVPQGCNITDIRAKFTDCRLQITMPKKIATQELHKKEQKQPTSTSQEGPKWDDTQNPKPDASSIGDQGLKAPIPSNENDHQMGTVTNDHESKEKDHMFGLRNSIAKLQVGKKLAVNFGIAIVVMVAIGAFVAYKCGSNPSCSHLEDLGLGL